jgi:phosphonate transport system permease protein
MDKLKPNVQETLQLAPKTLLRNLLILLVLGGLTYWSFSTINFRGINETGLTITRYIFGALINPNQQWLFTLERYGIPFLMLETVAIAFLGTLIGGILSIPFAFLSSRNITGRWGSLFGSTSVAMVRTFPVFVLGLMFIKVTGPGPFAGVLTIGLSSIGMITKLYVEAIEDIDKGVIEALDATGCNAIQKIQYGIIPQLSANFLSTTIYRFEINVRNATVLGLVGAGGIGFTLVAAMSAYRWNDAAAALWGIVIVVLVIEYISTKLRNKITAND